MKLFISFLFSCYSFSLFYTVSVVADLTSIHVDAAPPFFLRALSLFGVFWWIIPPLLGVSFFLSPSRFFASEFYPVHILIFVACALLATGGTVLEVLFLAGQGMPKDGVQYFGNIFISTVIVAVIALRMRSRRAIQIAEVDSRNETRVTKDTSASPLNNEKR